MSKHANLEGLKDRLPKPPASSPVDPLNPNPPNPQNPPPAPPPPVDPPAPRPPQDPPDPSKKLDPPKIPAIPDSLLPGRKPSDPPAPPPPKADDPPPVIPDAELVKLPTGTQQAIRNQRTHIDRLEATIAELRKKSAGANVELEQKLAALQKDHEDALAQIERVSLERSPRFRAKFEKPKQELLGQIKQYMKEFGIEDASIADQAASLPIKERMTLLHRECGDAVSTLVPLFASIDSIERARASELSVARETYQREEEEANRRANEFKSSTMQSAIETLRNNGHFVFARVEGDDEWNRTVDSVEENVKGIFSTSDPKIAANALALGAIAPIYLQMFHTQREETERLRAELAKYVRVMPRIGGDNPPPPPPTFDRSKPMTPQAAAEAMTERIPQI